MENKSTFKSKHSDEVYQIKKKINCNSKLVVYLIECRVCRKQCHSSAVTKCGARANNYKSTHRNFWKLKKLSDQARNQKRYHEYYRENDHNGICGWEITIIDQAKKELYWYLKLKTCPF